MFDDYDTWIENVDDEVYAFFSAGIYELQDFYESRLDLNTYFEEEYSPEDVINVIHDLIEEDEYGEG